MNNKQMSRSIKSLLVGLILILLFATLSVFIKDSNFLYVFGFIAGYIVCKITDIISKGKVE